MEDKVVGILKFHMGKLENYFARYYTDLLV